MIPLLTPVIFCETVPLKGTNLEKCKPTLVLTFFVVDPDPTVHCDANSTTVTTIPSDVDPTIPSDADPTITSDAEPTVPTDTDPTVSNDADPMFLVMRTPLFP